MSEELRAKLMTAQSLEEVTELLKEAGADEPLAERLWAELEHKREADGRELSLDELDAVSGGRDYFKDGCASTVEPGSDCWNVDGGCVLVYYEYEHMPNAYCENCGGPCYVENSYNPLIGKHRTFILCNNCNSQRENVWWDNGKPIS